MRKIKPKFVINKYIGLYFETVLSSLSTALLSGLVRDVDEAFLSSTVTLPVNDKGGIDFIWIENFEKQQKKDLLYRLVRTYRRELYGEEDKNE